MPNRIFHPRITLASIFIRAGQRVYFNQMPGQYRQKRKEDPPEPRSNHTIYHVSRQSNEADKIVLCLKIDSPAHQILQEEELFEL